MELRERKERHGWKVELIHKEQSVSRLWIVDRHMRIGASTVYVGGIAGVGTNQEYRKKGLASQVLNASLALMQREGYDLSFLFGIADFYHRFGFVTAMAEHGVSLDTRAAEKAKRVLKVRSVKEKDWGAIARLYNRDNQYRTGSVVRDVRRFKQFAMGSGFGVPSLAKVLVDAADKPLGYVLFDNVQDRCRAAEVGGQGEAVWSTALHLLAQRAVALRRERVTLSMPADHGFALYCRDYGLQLETRYNRNSGPMARVINLASFMTALRPEFERRAQEIQARPVELRTDLGNASVWVDGSEVQVGEKKGKKDVVGLEQTALVQMTMGYQSAANLAACGRLKATTTVRERLDRILPLQQAHMWWPDRF